MLLAVIICIILVLAFVMLNPISSSSLEKSRDLKLITEKYSDDYLNPNLLEEIYSYCVKSKMLNHIIEKHNATIKDFSVVYIYLMHSCPVKKHGHFVPVSTFFFASSLDYALSHKNLWTQDDTEWILRYFD